MEDARDIMGHRRFAAARGARGVRARGLRDAFPGGAHLLVQPSSIVERRPFWEFSLESEGAGIAVVNLDESRKKCSQGNPRLKVAGWLA